MNQEAEKLSGIWEKRETRAGNVLYVNWEKRTQLLQNFDEKTGYGGRKFLLTLIDGSEEILEGPWASCSEIVKETFPDRIVDWD